MKIKSSQFFVFCEGQAKRGPDEVDPFPIDYIRYVYTINY
jgi:hypothetical protein